MSEPMPVSDRQESLKSSQKRLRENFGTKDARWHETGDATRFGCVH
jgi:hypothetical protein